MMMNKRIRKKKIGREAGGEHRVIVVVVGSDSS